jgi:hypothetical protein
MYHLNVRTADDIIRVGVKGRRKAAAGEKGDWQGMVATLTMTDAIGCTETDCTSNHWRYGGDDRYSVNPAATAWVEEPQYPGSKGSVAFLCTKHTGLLRGLRSRSFRNYGHYRQAAGPLGKKEVEYNVHTPGTTATPPYTVEEVASDPAAVITWAAALTAKEKAEAKRSRSEYVAETRAAKLAAFHSARDTDSYYGAEKFVVDPRDEYGRIYISTNYGRDKMTPTAARALAARLTAMADKAEEGSDR